jgi:RHS repeat-associated protein
LSGNPLNESSLGATNLREYVYFSGRRVARIDVPSPLTVKYYFSDHLGSASVITSDLGVIQEESDYFPFGGEITITNGDSNTYKFTGKERDTESGLDNFEARHFVSNLGRFMQPDEPFVDQEDGIPQSWNLYSYVRNNPLKSVDPEGNYHTECKKDDNGQETCYIVGDFNGELVTTSAGVQQWNAKAQQWDQRSKGLDRALENMDWFANYALEQTVGNWVNSLGRLSVANTTGSFVGAAVGLLPLSLGPGEVQTAKGIIQISEHAAEAMAEHGVTTTMAEKAIPNRGEVLGS